ncbi:MAG: hypothetical protein H6719_10245 [Sandaracinaceae bacterium]|nr:hypothetical protein [Sandaracinaceae bacterium]
MSHSRLSYAIVLLLAGCAFEGAGAHDEEITGISGDAHVIEWESFVYVPEGADEAVVRWAIQRQVKSSLGALREMRIGIQDRDAQGNLDPSTWSRRTLTVAETGQRVERITYRYRDRAIAWRGSASSLTLPLLFGDYAARRDELVPDCTDDAEAAADSLWYHFAPSRSSCRTRIAAEQRRIEAARATLAAPADEISQVDLERSFVSVRATLSPAEHAPTLYPEYDRLFARDRVVAYAFFGVDANPRDPGDYGLREMLRMLRRMRAELPGLHLVETRPGDHLTAYEDRGEPVPGVTFDDVTSWIVDETGYPAGVDREALRAQVVDHFLGRWTIWEQPTRLADGRTVTIELRVFYGEEDGSAWAHDAARNRYLEAFWYGDVFAYTGHSHFGHGPLNPTGYGAGNFPDRYQVMLVNSCLSFNYYDDDFVAMHPGGSANLDVVSNGLPAYWHGMGEATAGYLVSLLDGRNRSWRDLLESMRVDLPWAPGYDPLRVVHGELDNAYTPSASRLATPVAPTSDWQRTIVFYEVETQPGQDLFLMGGVDHGFAASALGRRCDPFDYECAIPIRHRNRLNPTTAPGKVGDDFLDWYGWEPGQPYRTRGTPADWTTDVWPDSWGAARTVERDGYGATPLNTFGPHYWMLDVDMDCAATADGHFELKGFVTGIGWESDVHQAETPYPTANHVGRCGAVNVFHWGRDEAEIVDL